MAFMSVGKKGGEPDGKVTAVRPHQAPQADFAAKQEWYPNLLVTKSARREAVSPPDPKATRLALKSLLPGQHAQTKPDLARASAGQAGRDVFFRSGQTPITAVSPGRPVVQAKFWELTASGKYEWHEEEAGAQFEAVMEGSAQKKYGRKEDWFSWPVYRLKPTVLTAVKPMPAEDETLDDLEEITDPLEKGSTQPSSSLAATKKKKKKKKKPSGEATVAVGVKTDPVSTTETSLAAEPENPLTSWQAIYRSQPEIAKWKASDLLLQINYLQKQIDAEWKKFSTHMTTLQEQAVRPENAAFKEEIESVIGRLQLGWPVYNGKLNDFAPFIKLAGNLAVEAADYAGRAVRGWNYFLKPQPEDMWWDFLPATANTNIKQIATHANKTQHTADHRPETIQYFQTALKDKHFQVAGEKLSMLNGSGHLYDLANLNRLTVDEREESLAKVYGYVWQNGTLYTGGKVIPGSSKKTLSTFPLFNHLGHNTGTFTLSKPLMVIVNTMSNDLSKDPGTAYIKI